MFVQESVPISISSVNTILNKIEEAITIKEIDKKRKPYSVKNTLSLCLKNSIASVLRPDPRFDDTLLCVEESCAEPISALIDNCKGDARINKVNKQLPDLSNQTLQPD
jgi:hypothetical protein